MREFSKINEQPTFFLETKNLLKQAWQIFLCSSLVAPGRFIVEPRGVKSNYFRFDLAIFK